MSELANSDALFVFRKDLNNSSPYVLVFQNTRSRLAVKMLVVCAAVNTQSAAKRFYIVLKPELMNSF